MNAHPARPESDLQLLEVELASKQGVSLNDLLEVVLDSALPQNYEGVFVGLIKRLDEAAAMIEIPRLGTLAARCTVSVSDSDLGKEVAVMFENGDPAKALLIGIIRQPTASSSQKMQVDVDNERLVLSAEREIVLQCGDASITLTRAGKVLIRGAYVSSRSSGVNRVKGGSVQIN